MNKIWNHFKTITRHRNKVLAHCFRAGIPVQGLLHDLSKYSPCEFMQGCRFYQGTRSPHEAERETYGFSYAWMHHKGRNRHHFEYWTDYDFKTRKLMPVRMPVKYVKEMFCDRVAASRIYNKENYKDSDPLDYYLKGLGHYIMHEETDALLHSLLQMLADKGEEYTFAYIKKNVMK